MADFHASLILSIPVDEVEDFVGQVADLNVNARESPRSIHARRWIVEADYHTYYVESSDKSAIALIKLRWT